MGSLFSLKYNILLSLLFTSDLLQIKPSTFILIVGDLIAKLTSYCKLDIHHSLLLRTPMTHFQLNLEPLLMSYLILNYDNYLDIAKNDRCV